MTEPDPVPAPLDHLLLRGVGDTPALVTEAVTLTFEQAERRVGEIAAALTEAKLPAGARVATWLPKTIEACLMPLACARAGLVHVPINPVLRRAQVAHIVSDSGASLLLTSQGRAASFEPADVSVDCRLVMEGELISTKALPPSSANADSLAAILYTSGSTGKPKGVMLSHANLWLGAVSVAHFLELAPDDRTLAVLPLGFDYGQNQLFSSWYAGGAVVPFDYLLARDVVRAVGKYAITTLAAVPPLWLQLVERDWGEAGAGMRRVTNSGGALNPALIDRLAQTFPNADLYPMYGLTEAFRATYLDPALVRAHPTSIGTAIPFAEVMIVDAEGHETGTGVPGELVQAGPLVARGYWRDEARTMERFRPAPSWSLCGGNAVWSGDTVTREPSGLHYFVGREDEMIKTSGNRVSPFEVEEVALASGETVQAVAYGVPDERRGQAIRLVVRGTGDRAALVRYLKAQLPSYMQPADIVWREDFPRTASGKLDRAAIRLGSAS